MEFELLTCREALYKGDAYQVILPAQGGQIAVLNSHQPFLCRLIPGYIKIIAQKGGRRSVISFLINNGLAKMTGNNLVVLAQE